MTTDLVLSSGFLAFARHIGFLDAIEVSGIEVDGVCGTSSGSMVGALWAAGHSLDFIASTLSAQTPLSMCGLHTAPWRGAFSLSRVIARLAEQLPPTFAGLERPFAVGVMDLHGRHALLREGPLPAAVAASCAMPWVFRPVEINGAQWQDGGAVDRTGLAAWRELRPDADAILHLVERSHGPDGQLPVDRVRVVRSPRSGATMWNLGDFDRQRREARSVTENALS